jgi:hypothetical protein
MVVLNADPQTDNPFLGLPLDEALKLLLSTLTDAQWQALIGDGGLGAADMSSDDQRALFADLLPAKPWKIIPQNLIGTKYHPGDDRDVTDERSQSKLLLRMAVTIVVPSADGVRVVSTSAADTADGKTRYATTLGSVAGESTVAGVSVREEVPNARKSGQLDLDAKQLQVQIPLAGLKTVGDLIYRIGNVAHLELYADPHYEKKTLTIAGTAGSASAADLLRALGLCLTAAYRRVGPAYVLTDDVQGVGTRRQIIAEFVKDVDAQRQGVLAQASTALAKHSLFDLQCEDTDLALSAAEQKAIQESAAYRAIGMGILLLPLNGLTTGQQQAINTQSSGTEVKGFALPGGMTGKATVTAMPSMEWQLPSVDGIISGSSAMLTSLFMPTGDQPQSPMPPPVPQGPTTQWSELIRPLAQRALLVHPRTVENVKADIAVAEALALNQLWVDAFSAGQAHEKEIDEALKAAKGTGLSVYAVLNLLDWGPKATADDADLTILGETSAQAAAAQWDRDAKTAAEKGEPTPGPPSGDVFVSPFSPNVRQALLAEVKHLVSKPGLAGMVWQGADPPGYGRPPGDIFDSRPMLGYTPSERLAFLRLEHEDPLDLPTSSILLFGTDTSLPEYDNRTISNALEDKWRLLRTEIDVTLLRGLQAAAKSDQPQFTLFVHNRGDSLFDHGGWYGSWDDKQASLPTFVDPWTRTQKDQPSYSWSAAAQARPQSRIILVRVPLIGVLTKEGTIAAAGQAIQKLADEKQWDGFVLEASQEAFPVVEDRKTPSAKSP